MKLITKKIEHYFENLRDFEFKGIVLTTESRIDFHEMNTTSPPLTRLPYEKLMLPMVFYFHKHSLLIESFNSEIPNLKSSGIFSMWKSRFRRRSISRKFLETDEARPLTIMQITSFCGYWSGGVICSITCLILEIFWGRYGQKVNNIFRYFIK